MTNPKDSAMPHVTNGENQFGTTVQKLAPGLSKREIFAMAAMQGILTNTNLVSTFSEHSQTATEAVTLADALIAELNK